MEEISNQQLDIGRFPSLSEIEFSPLAPRYPMLSAIETAVFWLFPIIPITVINLFADEVNIPYPVYFALGVLAILSIFIAYFGAKAKGFALRERDVIYKQGIFWRKQTCVSFKRIQHIDISHGPIERYFGLTSIKFFTAGGALADLKISGLQNEDAEQMRTYILEKIGIADES